MSDHQQVRRIEAVSGSMIQLLPLSSSPRPSPWFVFRATSRIAAGARDLSRRNARTTQACPQKFQSLLRSPTPLRNEVRGPSLAGMTLIAKLCQSSFRTGGASC